MVVNSIQLFQYRAAATDLLAMLVVLLAVERVSTVLRSPIVDLEGEEIEKVADRVAAVASRGVAGAPAAS